MALPLLPPSRARLIRHPPRTDSAPSAMPDCSSQETGRILLLISRQDVASGQVANVAARLNTLIADRASAQSAKGKLTLIFQGYEGETRPLFMLPDLRAWFSALNQAWPYWAFFANREDETLYHVLTLLLPGRTITGEGGRVGWKFDLDEDLKPLLQSLLTGQRTQFRCLEMDLALEETATQDFFKAVFRVIT